MAWRPATEGAAYLRTEYDAEFRLKAYEDSVVVNDFDMPQGVDKLGNQLVIRIIPIVSATSLATSDTGLSLSYDSTAGTSVTCTPVTRYAAVQIPEHQLSKMARGEDAALKAGYRNQLMGALKENFDAYACSTLAPSVSTVKGPANFDKAGLLDAAQSLRTNAKGHAVNAQVFVKYHPSQGKYLKSISEIMNADARGDSSNPNVTGIVVKAWGMTFGESGNIYSAAGTVYNMIHLKSAFVRGYNTPAKMLEPQAYELVTRFIAFLEGGVVEVFDEDAVTYKSAA